MITAKSSWAIPILGLLLASLAIAKEGPPASAHDGLKLVEKAQVDLAYTLTGADFADFQPIMVLEAEVACRLGQAAQIRGTL